MTAPEQPAATASPIRRFALKPARRLGREALLSLGLVVLVTSGLVFGWMDSERMVLDWEKIGLGLLVSVGLPLAVLGVLALLRRSDQGLEILLGPAGISFPRLAGESFTLPYERIQNVELRGRGLRTVVVIDTVERELLLPAQGFEPPTSAVELVEAIRAGISQRPEGRTRLTHIDRLSELAQALTTRRPVVTWTLLALLAVVFLLENLHGGLADPLGAVDLGANASALVRAGQVDRLLSSNFIHGGLLHVYLACAGLLLLGTTVERIVGKEAMLVVFGVSALGGGLASAAAAEISLGATGALFGLAGSLGVLNFTYGPELPFVFRRRWSWWLSVMFANAFLPALVPDASFVAHLGGFVAGGIITYAIAVDRPLTPTGVRTGPAVGAGAWAVVLIALVCGTLTGLRARAPTFEDRLTVLDTLDADSEGRAEALNGYAFAVAIDPAASKATMESARRAAVRAAKRRHPNEHVIDTVATLELRLGHLDEAVELERVVFAANARAMTASEEARRTMGELGHPIYATQLARFMLARLEAKPDAEDRRLHAELAPTEGAPRLVLGLGELAGRRVHAFLLPLQGGKDLRGLIEVCLGPEHEETVELELKGESLDWPKGQVALRVGRVDAVDPKARVIPGPEPEVRPTDGGGASTCALEGRASSVQVWPAKAEILAYPR